MKGRSHQLPPLYLTEVTFNREERNSACISEGRKECIAYIKACVKKERKNNKEHTKHLLCTKIKGAHLTPYK